MVASTALVLLISTWVVRSDADAKLHSAMAERTTASLAGDVDTIESLTADGYLQTDIFGRVQSKSEWLAEYFKPLAVLIKGGQFRWDVWDEKDVQIREFGDVAVVVGSLTLKGSGASIVAGRGWVASPQSTIGPVTLRFTRLWIKRNGKWLLAALHNAMVPPPPH
jgi:ketosteroid isomerase-like protein